MKALKGVNTYFIQTAVLQTPFGLSQLQFTKIKTCFTLWTASALLSPGPQTFSQ